MRYTLIALDHDIGKPIAVRAGNNARPHGRLDYFWTAAVKGGAGSHLFFSGENDAYNAVMLGFDILGTSDYRPHPRKIYMVSEADLTALNLVLELMDLGVDDAIEDPSCSDFFVKLPIPEEAVYRK